MRRQGVHRLPERHRAMGANMTKALDDKVVAGTTYRYRVYAVFPGAGGPVGSEVSNAVEAVAK